jgi:single-stranded-DNA-specific exonuclease
MNKRWTLVNPDKELSRELQRSLGINPVLCELLVTRGIKTYDQAKDFFRPQLSALHSPWLMKDMEKAVDRILQAMKGGENILIYGDYDVDGTTSVALVYGFLQKVYPQINFYIPHRYREGYGVSRAGIDHAYENKFSLIISLDCGIKSIELITYAKSLGIDFVVCDHHLPDEELPPAVAILNAKQTDCPYPYKDLCGCGVGFKLISALTEKLELHPETPYQFLDLVATAIAADIVPVTGENRILAYHGLIKANREPNLGIKALTKLSGMEGELQITSLVFMIAPRVNAAGRMDDARKAVQLFISSTLEEATMYGEMLHSDNSDRKEADTSTTEEALALLGSTTEWKNRKSTVVYQPHWHKGVVGIVASRLIDHYYRPTVVLTSSGEYAAGSARSVPGFNLYEAIHACREHLLGYGGHFAAAGLTLEKDKIETFREKFESVVAATIKPEQLVPEIVIDAELKLSEINKTFYNILCQMEPFGPENPKPIFLIRSIQDSGWSKIVKEQHVKFSLKNGNATITGIGFNLSEKFLLLEKNKPVDIVCTIDENDWNGNKSIQLKVADLRPSEN